MYNMRETTSLHGDFIHIMFIWLEVCRMHTLVANLSCAYLAAVFNKLFSITHCNIEKLGVAWKRG